MSAAASKLRAGLNKATARLKERAGERLLMAAAYGAVVRTGFKPTRSDVTLLFVFDEVDRQVLDVLRDGLAEMEDGPRVIPLVLSRPELEASSDAFATLIADARTDFVVLVGEDLLTGLALARENIRLACERDVRNSVMRLRRAYLLGRAKPGMMRVALDQALPPLLGTLRVVAGLGGGRAPQTLGQLLVESGKQLDYDFSPLEDAARVRAGGSDNDDLEGIYERLFGALDAISRAVDQL